MNNEITQMQQMSGTDNPQSAQESNMSANDASQFQQSASSDVLSQSRELQVVNTGKPNEPAKDAGLTGGAIAFAIISTIVLIAVAYTIFKWVMKQPETLQSLESDKKPSTTKQPQKATVKTSKTVAKSTKTKKSKPPVKKKTAKTKRKK